MYSTSTSLKLSPPSALETLQRKNITTAKAEKRWDQDRGMFGLYAVEDIAPGEIVWVSFLYPEDCDFYSWADLERRRELIHFAYQIDADVFSHTKNVDHDISNFLNHSCEPNCWYDHSVETKEQFARDYFIDMAIVEDPEIEYIVAGRHIRAGEEITMDYSTFWIASDLGFECRCGNTRCRGFITKNDFQMLDPNRCSIHVKRRLETLR